MKKQKGFSLIELMMAVALIAVLLFVALPSYRWVIKEGTRSEAKQMAMKIALRQGLYLMDARAYSDRLDISGLNLREEGWRCSAFVCSNANHEIRIEGVCLGACDGSNEIFPLSFRVRATAKEGGANAGEEDLTIDHAGHRTGPWD